MLSSGTENNYNSQIELTTANITLRNSFDLPENTIHVRREQLLANEVFFDRLTFENFNLSSVDLLVELTYDADFVDVFQVRGVAREAEGQYFQPIIHGNRLSFYYRGRDGILRFSVVEMTPAPDDLDEHIARWELKLPPLKKFSLEVTVTPFVEGRESRATGYDHAAKLRLRREKYTEWRNDSTHFESSQGVFDAMLNTAIGDFHALQVPDRDQRTIDNGNDR